MKKKAVALVLLFILFGGLYASGGKINLETGLGPVYPLSSFIIEDGVEEKVPLDEYVNGGVGVVSGLFYNPARWFGIGLVTLTDVIRLEDGTSRFLISFPVMAAIRISPYLGRVSFPLTVSGGGHLQMLGGSVKAGPAFGASVGIVMDVTDSLALSANAMVHALVQFSDDGRIAYQSYVIPFSIGMRSSF